MSEVIPIVKVRDILIASMPPEPDDTAIDQFQDRITAAMERWNPRGVVVDLNLVQTLDSFFARTLVDTARMVGLMGGRMVTCGMAPAVAITLTQLGLNLATVATALDVDSALDQLDALRAERRTDEP